MTGSEEKKERRKDTSQLKPTDIEYQKAVMIAKQVFELIGLHGVPPVPKMYDLWFQYAAKSNDELVEKLDTELRDGEQLSFYELDQLHQEYAAPDHETYKVNEQISQGFGSELAEVRELLRQSAASTERYGDTLDSVSKALPEAKATGQVDDIVKTLIEQNKAMRDEVERLESGLEDAQSHVNSLSSKLDEAIEQGRKDPLTMLGNRRHFDVMLRTEIERVEKTCAPLSLVMVDIDHFKKVNDTFGHPVGDAVIKKLAGLIGGSVKGRDTAARYGGEEFALILPETQIEDALQLMEKIRCAFGESSLVIRGTGQKIGKVTASFGLSAYEPGDTPERLLEKSDAALYEAKRTGRNRSVCHQHNDAVALKQA